MCGCNARSNSGSVPHLPDQVVVWADPQDETRQGIPVRDANNDEGRFVLIGTDDTVQFMPDDPKVCNDCAVNGATITLESGQQIDIRFGVGAVGGDERRPFLVDRTTGNFIQLLGGGSQEVTFQVTDAPLEEDNDRTDDLAIRAGALDNPAASSDTGGQGGPLGSLCGATGGGIILLLPGILVAWHSSRRRH